MSRQTGVMVQTEGSPWRLPFLYILHVTRSCIQGLGNTLLPMASGISEFFMRTGGALLLPAVIGETGVMRAEVLAWIGADMILIPGYYYTMRQTRRRLAETEESP